jgi:predicted nucleotidyltransferase
VESPERVREVDAFIRALEQWAAERDDVIAVALLGSWARGAATSDSDVDIVVLTDNPNAYIEREDWIAPLAPGAELLRTGDWGAIAERRLVLRSGLEVEVGVGLPSWADTAPVDPGTRGVIRDGFQPVFDPQGLLAELAAACRGST